MKDIILHIGIPKTGSSALQVYWARNQLALRTQSIEYFTAGDFSIGATGAISSGNGARLARCLAPNDSVIYLDDIKDQLSDLKDQISASHCQTGLLSSELFIDIEDGALRHFRNWIEEQSVKLRLFFFIRNQIDFLASSYVQQVKRHRYTGTPDEFARSAYNTIPYLNFDSLLQRAEDLVGPDNVICKVYDIANLTPTGIYNAFTQSFQLNADTLTPVEENINPGLTPDLIGAMRVLNKFQPRMDLSDQLLYESHTNYPQRNLFSQDVKNLISDYFEDSNTRIASRYFNRKELFPANGDDLIQIDPVSVVPTTAGLLEALARLIVKLDDRLAKIEADGSR